MNATDVVTTWATRWRNLLAWGAPLPAVLKVTPYKGGPLGRASCQTKIAEVRVTGDLAEDLGTALHELAHIAAPAYVSHEEAWRAMFVRATCEALGTDPDMFDTAVTITNLDAQVVDAVRAWLRTSGQAAVLRACGVPC